MELNTAEREALQRALDCGNSAGSVTDVYVTDDDHVIVIVRILGGYRVLKYYPNGRSIVEEESLSYAKVSRVALAPLKGHVEQWVILDHNRWSRHIAAMPGRAWTWLKIRITGD